MMQARTDVRDAMLVRLFALHAVRNDGLRIARRVQDRRESKCQQLKHGERIAPAHRRHAQRISLGHAHLDRRRQMDRLLRSVVLRQSPVHHPAAHCQHHDEQTHTELATERALSRMDPGTPKPLRCRVIVHVLFQNHSLFRMQTRRRIVELFFFSDSCKSLYDCNLWL
jgi:hypothetical protein